MNTKKILILGANGMAGHTITLYLLEKGYQVTAFTRKPFFHCKNIIGDVCESEKLKEILLSDSFGIIINCIGVLNKDAEFNKSQAIFINSYLPYFISETLKNKNTKLIHLSTDCVFKGNTGPYYENSFKDGDSYYDRTKALGEIIDNKNLTFRTSIIGPDINPNGIGLFNWFMKQSKEINGFTKAIWTGVTTLTLAKAIERSIETNLSGLYHLVNNSSISKYDLLQIFNKIFKQNKIQINKYDDFFLDKTLISKRQDFSFEVPSYEDMIIEMKNWIDSHKYLYTQY